MDTDVRDEVFADGKPEQVPFNCADNLNVPLDPNIYEYSDGTVSMVSTIWQPRLHRVDDTRIFYFKGPRYDALNLIAEYVRPLWEAAHAKIISFGVNTDMEYWS